MRLISFEHQGTASWGLLDGARVIDAGPLASRFGATLKEALQKDTLSDLGGWAATADAALQLANVNLLPVIPDPQKILCVGINYLSHVQETGREVPKHPMIFTRWADSQTGHEGHIVRPNVSEKLDFEGELAVVIGKRARHVKQADALQHVAGYACYNDGTVRDWQKHTIQFTPGKNFPATGGFGPCLVTPDEVGDPSSLKLITRLNGAIVQEAFTNDLIFDVARLIEYCSVFTELLPGDVIITGTTGGVGAFRDPPLWMKPGDVVEVEISRVGTLRNIVVDELL
ncbi:5-oxopent-3-ene-1,2,5-tricarboxylate decarboxylase [Caballeronia turbans]|jgi:2-keto-4-pentenoate hydratase/2-oxohepta-3-ene-1,7-dioic acid hydratase in catechol pathway|uniref:5-oxopent-3-ene-1,2,5-tricarboxylate decarboxylase n=1 Tax=Caballeronia cordobensis TaxID=1353886 RepID=A0A158I763_CABCO|nr:MULTISPECIES: fumarylacetoacetate hydrolase family protein [Caballeronia]SAL42412.1 5-oxopent-3-ene-1,2,5-tricarboxylate decarboxylase [Caballeronia turbans]SAL51941.1 5-oxopent-3-ene-1,2,5-tricarboxylate decarboxylase [Caballeronia cordobensis]